MASNTQTAADTLDVSIALGLLIGAAVGYYLIGSWIVGIIVGVAIGSGIGLARAGE